MEALLVWLAQNLSWEALKKVLPASKHGELALFRGALADAQQRNVELEADRQMMERLIDQRDVALAKALEYKRRYAELEEELRASKARRKRR